MAGREWACSDESNMSGGRMSERFLECMKECFEKWTPRKRFTLYDIKQVPKNEKAGIII
jgi:hypothetical protein